MRASAQKVTPWGTAPAAAAHTLAFRDCVHSVRVRSGFRLIHAPPLAFSLPTRRVSSRFDPHMGILSWIVVGLIAGVLAKWIMPGKDPGGIVVTVLLGIVGAVVGGFLVGLVMPGDFITGINITTIVVATLGAILLLLIYRLIV